MSASDPQLEAAYRLQRIEDRRRGAEASLWALPGLSIAAQAFLFSAGLAHDATSGARLLAGALGFVIATATAYLLVYFGSRWLVYYLRTDPDQSLDAWKLLEQSGGKLGGQRFGSLMQWAVRSHRIGAVEAWAIVLAAFALGDVLMILDGAGVASVVS
jgi:hypothetical protein